MMVQESPSLPKPSEVETDAYSRGWRSVRALNSFRLADILEALGWNLFFVAGRIKTVALDLGGEKSVQKAVRRIAAKVGALDLNCLELSEVQRKHFLGVPYIAISAQPYHIQQGWKLHTPEQRRRLLNHNEG